MRKDQEPPEAFARHFMEEHGVELPSPIWCGYKPLSFAGKGAERPVNRFP
ncbi:MAG: hypothetical protein OXC93_13395 [Rhodospirillaceae bacterium]|nr:hypothetical protein [Rhodospirillaceae bacterium]